MTSSEDYQLPPKEGFVLTHFLTVADVQRSAEFYLRILDGLPALLTPAVYTIISKRLQEVTPQIGQATGYMLIGLGILLVSVTGLMLGR